MDIGTIEGFDIVRTIGEGGMAVVCEARNVGLSRSEAIKFLKPHLALDASIVDRFLREAKNSACLQHRNIVSIYGLGYSTTGVPYIRMELLNGIPFDEHMAQCGPFDVTEVCDLLEPIAEALDYAHDQGVIHRDIKPGNIFISRGSSGLAPKVLDFGISVVLDNSGTDRLTKAGMIVGTPCYMAPEQVDVSIGHTGAIDQYSLGIIAYEAVFGRTPLSESDGMSSIQILAVKCTREIEFPPLAEHVEESVLPPLKKALMRDPASRYETCCDFVTALRNHRDAQAVEPSPLPVTQTGASTDAVPSKKTQSLIWVAALVVVCAAGLAGLVVSQKGDSQPEPPQRKPVATSSLASFSMPQIIGLTRAEAFDVLNKLDVRTNSKSEFHPTIPEDEIMRQDPKPEVKAQPGALVTMVVSRGPEPLLPITDSDLRAFLGKWQGAIRRKDLVGYGAMYHPDFRGRTLSLGGKEGNFNRAQWLNVKNSQIKRLEEFTVEEVEPKPGTGVAEVAFWQTWGMDSYGDQGLKILKLKRLQGQLKVIEEKMLEVHGLEGYPDGLEDKSSEPDGGTFRRVYDDKGKWQMDLPSSFTLKESPSDSQIYAKVFRSGMRLIRVEVTKDGYRSAEDVFHQCERLIQSRASAEYQRISAGRLVSGAILWDYIRTTDEKYRQRNRILFVESNGIIVNLRVGAPIDSWHEYESMFNRVLNSLTVN